MVKSAYTRQCAAVDANTVEYSTANAPGRNRYIDHPPRVSVYMFESVLIISVPFGIRPMPFSTPAPSR